MNISDYQKQCSETAIYPGKGSIIGLMYVGLGLGESGEIQGKIKKILRDDNSVLTDERRRAIMKELGDLIWYVAMLATEIKTDMSDICQMNLHKLADRRERNVLRGSGDNR